ncbi:Fis family transcriptional regulator [Novimethylophilus kurashikiensis]|uniref:Fis family transcriptional regulator n=1 Tax=Novimethylophilus kurashikiensis TaxID=1825523 RepID=A0A2R5F7U2_9PROT|nr:3'-5' exoribonuclease [Novimethylophilus kurashikiensis]GBG14310.1 Fis family transcriptional regulator [Novimethylophilus kurashikiensis]
MRIFYDTEFTSLSAAAELISAGFVTEHGQEFYIEFDGIAKSECSDFVLEIVYPMLRAPGVIVSSPLMAAQHIIDWLAAQAAYVRLVSDNNYDSYLMSKLFHKLLDYKSKIEGYRQEVSPNLNIKYEHLGFPDYVAAKEFKRACEDYFLDHPDCQHHALHDARSLKHGVMRSEGYYS